MPVRLDEHDPDLDLTPGTTKSDIIAFLYDHSGLGFRPSEVSDRLDIPAGTATTTLIRLYDKDLVGKTNDSYYHAIENREDLFRYLASLEATERMFEDKDYEEHTDIKNPKTDFDEEAIEGELAELQAEIDE